MIDINNFDAIEIGLASSKQIRSWSSCEVTKPETEISALSFVSESRTSGPSR